MSIYGLQEAFGAQDKTTAAMKSALEQWVRLYYADSSDEGEDPCQRIAYTVVNKLVEGSSGYYLRGTLRSTYDISSVKSQILSSSGSVLYSAGASPNAKTFDLSELDNSTPFSRLSAGNYTFRITADDASGSHYELTSPFAVVSSTTAVTYTLDPSGGTCSPTTLTYKRKWNFRVNA